MKNKTLFMETTKIEVDKTIAEIQLILGRYGAGAVMTQFDKGEVVALTFQISLGDKRIPFKLPCRWQVIHSVFLARRKKPNKRSDDELQAKRVAWRQILRWVEAQMALVETDMVKVQEVFMPYVQVNLEGQTLYEKIEAKGFTMLEDKR